MLCIPRERTRAGAHLYLRIKDLPAFEGVNKLENPRVATKVLGEMFFHSRSFVVTSPSIHESGHRYAWEVYGDIPVWTWRECTSEFGRFVPSEEVGRRGRPQKDENRAKKFRGNLATLNLEAMLTEAGLLREVDSKDAAKFIITCPFEHEHSNEVDKGTAVWSPKDEKWPAFNCLHTRCGGRKTLDFLEQIERDHSGIVDKHCSETWTYSGNGSADAKGRIQVVLPQVGEQEKDDFVCEIGNALREKEFWFTANKNVVRIDTSKEIWVNDQGVEVE